MDTALREAKERWFDLSLPEQMVNIGNEVKRAVRFDNDSKKKRAFIDKALKYIDLTMDDPKNKPVVPEIMMGREILEDYLGEHKLDYDKEQIRDYYLDLGIQNPDKRLLFGFCIPYDRRAGTAIIGLFNQNLKYSGVSSVR